MYIALYLVTFLAISGLLLFSFLVFPILSLVRIINDRPLKEKGRVIWLVSSLSLFPVVPCIYSIFYPKSKWYFMGAIFSSTLTIGVLGSAVWLAIQTKPMVLTSIEKIKSNPPSYFAELSGQNKDELFERLDFLSQEISHTAWYQFTGLDVKRHLVRLLEAYCKDQTLTESEYSDWNTKYLNRELLDSNKLSTYPEN